MARRPGPVRFPRDPAVEFFQQLLLVALVHRVFQPGRPDHAVADLGLPARLRPRGLGLYLLGNDPGVVERVFGVRGHGQVGGLHQDLFGARGRGVGHHLQGLRGSGVEP